MITVNMNIVVILLQILRYNCNNYQCFSVI